MATKDELLYTDGYDVIVTPSKLEIKGSTYWLSAIRRQSLAILKPDRITGFFIGFLGVGFILFGMLCLVTPPEFSRVIVNGNSVNVGIICLEAGGVVLGIGIFIQLMRKEKFAVRITTDKGDKDVIVSSSKEYINEIVRALDDAVSRVQVRRPKTASFRLYEN